MVGYKRERERKRPGWGCNECNKEKRESWMGEEEERPTVGRKK